MGLLVDDDLRSIAYYYHDNTNHLVLCKELLNRGSKHENGKEKKICGISVTVGAGSHLIRFR